MVGAGPIGIAAAIFAGLQGAAVTMLDTRDDRLSFCRNPSRDFGHGPVAPDDTERLSALTDGDFFDVVFDATGNPKAMERGFRFVAHGGTYVLVSIVAGDITFSDPEFHKRETSLLGSRNATGEDFETVMAAMRSGQISHRRAQYPPDDASGRSGPVPQLARSRSRGRQGDRGGLMPKPFPPCNVAPGTACGSQSWIAAASETVINNDHRSLPGRWMTLGLARPPSKQEATRRMCRRECERFGLPNPKSRRERTASGVTRRPRVRIDPLDGGLQ